MKVYLEILNKILISPYSVHKKTRTGVDTLSLSGVQFEHDMKNGFPLLTTKKMGIKSISAELEFFIKGLSDKRWLQERGCTIWDEWGNPEKVKLTEQQLKTLESKNVDTIKIDKLKIQKNEPDLGRIYGVQWRHWGSKYRNDIEIDGFIMPTATYWDEGLDQMKDIIERAKKNPLDRRLLVTAWRPDELHEMALPPCHYAWQILSDGYYLDLIWVQRSVDVGLGLPYNIASYGLLLLLLSKELKLTPRRLVGQLGDTHIYENHKDKLIEQMGRVPYDLPTVNILNFTNIFDWTYSDIELLNYQHHPKINLEIAI